MQDWITCPVCGESNPADAVFCQNCQWRLRAPSETTSSEVPSSVPGQPQGGAGERVPEEELPQWLREARQEALRSARTESSSTEVQPAASSVPPDEDLLAGLVSQEHQPDEDLPDWVAQITGLQAGQGEADVETQQQEFQPPSEGNAELQGADAIYEVRGESGQGFGPEPPLSGLGSEPSEASGPDSVSEARDGTGENDEIYDWLRQLDASAAQEPAAQEIPEAPSTEADVPVWVKNLGAGVRQRAAPPGGSTREVLPDWLRQPEVEDNEETPAPESPSPGASVESVSSETAQAAPFLEKETDIGAAAPGDAKPTDAGGRVSAFTPEGLSSIDVDAVFASMKMPDWLSEVAPHEAAAGEPHPPAAQEPEPIEPAELPSWVQAMRPVESVLSSVPPDSTGLPPEERGPLLGLHGVLPAIPGAAVPSSKPKVHAMRLEATEQQLAHASLLEEILAAERKPLPMMTPSLQRSQRALRWGIAALLLLVVGGAVFSGSRSLPMPNAVPNESIQAIQAVENIAAGAPVLVAIEYEPATTAEMEASAASLLDHLLLLKHPKVALISTSPTGSVLAERLMSVTLAERGYQPGTQYVNLGYLPGGLAGVQAFAQDPLATVPLDSSLQPAWNSAVLLGVTRLSDFAAILVLTDGLESGRVWIEQTALARAQTPMIMVSSAQAGPMLLPYVDSGQISGLVAGMYGAVGAELANGGLPGFIRRYWDAYDLGLYVAVIAIAVGGLWSFWAGIQERRAQAVS